MPRKHIVVTGRVQGVGFRYHAKLMAEANKLTGWVRNLRTGDVELEVQGREEAIEQFLFHLGRKSPFIRIDHMDIEDKEEIHESFFDIRQEE